VVVVARQDAPAARQFLESQGEKAYEIGSIRKREGNEHQTRVV
jgi:phosphoribosylformylglycinamidine cyclo-ligase